MSSLGEVIQWKGKTFKQLTPFLQRNKNSNQKLASFMLPNPVTQYRKEIASTPIQTCSQRASDSVNLFEQPGGNIITEEVNTVGPPPPKSAGIVHVMDPSIPNDTSVNGQSCITCNARPHCANTSTLSDNVCFSEENKARRRCRSAGMVQNKFKARNQNDRAYFTDNKQYLTSRNRLYSQNQYNYIRQGLPSAVPGSAQSTDNVYSANGLSHCPLYTIVKGVNDVLQYVWVDGTVHDIHIPVGEYDIYTFNRAFQQSMFENTHYYVQSSNRTIYYLIQFSFDTREGLVTLQLLPPSTYGSAPYSKGGTWVVTNGNKTPTLTLTNKSPVKGLGFVEGSYGGLTTEPILMKAQNKGDLQPDYVTVSYKPSNWRFANQGAVTTSSYIQRLKYDTVNSAAALTKPTKNYGSEVANELAYRASFVGYTTKDKVGFPNTKTPSIKRGGELRCCNPYIYRRG